MIQRPGSSIASTTARGHRVKASAALARTAGTPLAVLRLVEPSPFRDRVTSCQAGGSPPCSGPDVAGPAAAAAEAAAFLGRRGERDPPRARRRHPSAPQRAPRQVRSRPGRAPARCAVAPSAARPLRAAHPAGPSTASPTHPARAQDSRRHAAPAGADLDPPRTRAHHGSSSASISDDSSTWPPIRARPRTSPLRTAKCSGASNRVRRMGARHARADPARSALRVTA